MKIKIFIAGSTDLSEKMDLFRSVANKLSVDYDQKGIDIIFLAVSCKDFDMLHRDGGQQKVYDQFISERADVVFFIFDSVIGDKTFEEYKLAYTCFKRTSHPKLQVFINKRGDWEAVKNQLLDYAKESTNNKLDEGIEQYFTLYKTNKDIVREAEKSLRNIAQSYVNNPVSISNINEQWGVLFQAQQIITSKPNKALDLFEELLTYKFNNWKFYFSIGVYAGRLYNDRANKIATEAYSQAKDCSFQNTEISDHAKVFIYSGAMKRRLGRLEEALEDISKGYDIIKDRKGLAEYDIKVDAIYNLYVVNVLLNKSAECDNLISDMRKFMLSDSDVNRLISRAEKRIDEIKCV